MMILRLLCWRDWVDFLDHLDDRLTEALGVGQLPVFLHLCVYGRLFAREGSLKKK